MKNVYLLVFRNHATDAPVYRVCSSEKAAIKLKNEIHKTIGKHVIVDIHYLPVITLKDW